MKSLIYFELKKTFGLTKTIICIVLLLIVCTITFFGFMNNVNYFEDKDMHDTISTELSGEITTERIEPYNKEWDEMTTDPDSYEIDELGEKSIKEELYQKYRVHEIAHHFEKINEFSKDTSELEKRLSSNNLSQHETILIKKNIEMLNQKGNMIAGKNIFFETNFNFLTYTSFQLLSILIVFFLAPLFTREYSSKMDAIILSSKNGKSKLITSKLITALITTSSIYVATIGYFALLSAIFLGIEGSNTSFNSYLFDSFPFINSPYDLTVLEYFISSSAISLIAGLSFAALVILVSSIVDKILISFVIPFIIFFAPWFLNELLGGGGGIFDHLMQYTFFNVIRVAPLYDHFSGIVAFGNIIMEKDIIITFTIIAMLVCAFLSAKVFQRHQVLN